MAAVLGCNRTPKQSPFGQMPDTNGTQMLKMPSGKLFGNSTPPPVPVELALPDANSKKPLSAETLVTVADTQLDVALDEKKPCPDKEAMLDRARSGYQKALKMDPKGKAALRGMAQFYARTGDREKALEMYKKCLTLHPDADLAHEVALTHARWKDLNGAVSWCEYALKIDPENRSVKKDLGFCLALVGKWDEAFHVLCQIMSEAQARTNLAGLLDQVGHHDACKIQLQLAVKADPNYAPAAEFLAELEQPLNPNPIRQAGDNQPAP
jgi:tetratricopeptide (TPR) repeat protein